MQAIPKAKQHTTIVCKGLEHLHEHLGYGQSNVVKKLKMLDHVVSAATLSNIKNGGHVGSSILGVAARGMLLLLQREMDMGFDPHTQDFLLQHTPGWVAAVVPEEPARAPAGGALTVHDAGRVSVQEKANFIRHARQEVLEVGVRLNSFANYFTSQNEDAYKMHILALLKKGVHVKSYLLDPDSNEARIYFEDRMRVQSFEKDSIGEIKKVIERLQAICAEFKTMDLPGKFEIYLYKHIPYSMFLVVDGGMEDGKMMLSHYLYGIRRANCPVLEFTKKEERALFRKYWESVQLFIADAKKLP